MIKVGRKFSLHLPRCFFTTTALPSLILLTPPLYSHSNHIDGTSQNLYAQREKELKSHLDSLKEEALQTQQSLIAQSKEAATTSGRLADDSTDAASVASLRARLQSAIATISKGLIERDTEVRLLLLAALAGEHILFIGPPGTAKSELGRRLSKLASGGRFFERLLTRFSVPEELFGPLSMRALEEDQYIRQTDGYLPTATVAFIDEIFKANSAILNTLLTILNERLFDNGSNRYKVPLICLVGASNELPESEELDALYDRFLVRKQVGQVSPAGLLEMLGGGRGGGVGARQMAALRGDLMEGMTSEDEDEGDAHGAPSLLLQLNDFQETRLRAMDAVIVPPSVLNLIADLRAFLQEKCEPPVYVSDRRLVKAVSLLQVAAYTNGRSSLTEYDCLLLKHILWQRPEEGERIADWLLERLSSDDGVAQSEYLLGGIFGRACKSLNDPEAMKELVGEVGALRQLLTEKMTQTYVDVVGGFPSITDSLWLGADEGAAIASALLPKLEKAKNEVERLLFEVVTLEVGECFEESPPPPSLFSLSIIISWPPLPQSCICRWHYTGGQVQWN
jgi:MoxR-like ATPase